MYSIAALVYMVWAGGDSCPIHQVFKCGFPKTMNFTCEPTCTPSDQRCMFVKFACKMGCYCDDGFILNKPGGKCVESCR